MSKKKKQEQFVPATITTRYMHGDAEQLIARTVETINTETVSDAQEFAELARPGVDEKGLGLYTENITRKYQVLCEEVNGLIGADNAKSEGSSYKKESEREVEELENRIHDTEHELRSERKVLASHNSTLGSELKRWHKVFAMIVLVGAAEWLMNAAAFLPIAGGVWLNAMLISFGVTIITFVFAHAIDHFAKKVQSIWGKIAVIIPSIIPVYILFNAMANFRYSRITDYGDDSIAQHIDKTDFIVINFLIFLFCLALIIAFRPKKGVKEEHKAYCKQLQKVEGLEQKITQDKERLSHLPKERDAKLSEYYAILVMAKNYEQIIESHHQQSLTLWIKTNLKHRKTDRDGRSPVMFNEPRPTLTTYFHDIQ